MGFPSELRRTRATRATAQRAANILLIVEELKLKKLTTTDLMGLLKFSSISGVRKYVKDLRLAKIVEISHSKDFGNKLSLGQAVYELIADDERVKAFIEAINPGHYTADERKAQVQKEKEEKPKTRNKKDLPETEDRHFHVMGDDTHFVIRIHNKEPSRDPLVAALFGNKAPYSQRQ